MKEKIKGYLHKTEEKKLYLLLPCVHCSGYRSYWELPIMWVERETTCTILYHATLRREVSGICELFREVIIVFKSFCKRSWRNGTEEN